MSGQYVRYPEVGGGSGIAVYTTFTSLPATATDGSAAITLDTDTLYIYNLATTTWLPVAKPGDALAIGTIDSVSPTANAAALTAAGNLIMQSASLTVPGVVNLTTQSFAGNKTFSGSISASNLSGTNTGNQTITLTGDVTGSGTGSFAATLASVATPGTNTKITYNAKGLVTSGAQAQFSDIGGSVAASQMPALTGDITTSAGTVATTLATVNSNVGSFGSSTSIPSFTVNGKGLITAAAANVVIAPAGTVTGTTLASNVVTSSLTTVGTIGAGVWQGTPVGLLYGGTGTAAASANAAFNALSPLTTKGDVIGFSTVNARLAVGTDGQVLSADSTQTIGLKWVAALTNPMTTLGDIIYENATPAPARLAGNTTATQKFLAQTGTGSVSAAPSWVAFTAPTIQKFTSGSGTYTTPAGALYIKVTMVGGGGGGGGSGSSVSGASGTDGSATTFGTTLLSAGGGSKGSTLGSFGAGGTSSLGSGPVGVALPGGAGMNGVTLANGGSGGSSALGGAGAGGSAGTGGTSAGGANTGGGGGGGSGGSGFQGGGGGGSGGYVSAIITAPSATYAYAVASAAGGGAAGTSGQAGAAGGSGLILVEEFYQ